MTARLWSLLLVAALSGLTHAAQPTVPLGRAAPFAVLAASSVTATGDILIIGDVGTSPGDTITFGPTWTVTGSFESNTVAAADAQADLEIAFNDAAARSNGVVAITGDLGGRTLRPGIYSAAGSLDLTTGDLTLDGRGNANAVFIFQTPFSLNVASGRRVLLTRGTRAARVFWQVGEAATLGPGAAFKGNILAAQSIDIQDGADLQGRALSRNGAVTLDAASVRLPAGGPGPAPTGVISVEELSVPSLNRQTGLFEQVIRLTNVGSNAVAAARAVIRQLRPGVTVYNESGRTGSGKPFVQYNVPLPVGGSVDLLVEYFRADRFAFRSANFTGHAVGPAKRRVAGNAPVPVLQRVMPVPGRNLIEFSANPGQRYVIRYSDDLETWKIAWPPVTARANRVLWQDAGPPKTETIPPADRAYERIKLR